jgi:hypothetical protein
VFGSVEFLGDEFPVPSQDRIGFGHASDLGQGSAPQSFSNFSQGRARDWPSAIAAGSFARKIRFSAARYSFLVPTYLTLPLVV